MYWRNFVKIFVSAKHFVAATSRTNSVWFDFLQHVAATKFCCKDKDFHKNSPVHTKTFVAATCRRDMFLNLSPSVYRPYVLSRQTWSCVNVYCQQNNTPGRVLIRVLKEEALPRSPIPYPFIHHFWQKRYSFRIPPIEKLLLLLLSLQS